MNVISKVQSICPICRKPLTGEYISVDGSVLFRRFCSEHGTFDSEIAEREEDFLRWTANPSVNIPPKRPVTKGVDQSNGSDLGSQCPLYCGTCENHLQTACCVLIDVTERCNQHCPYCFAKSEGDKEGELTLAEIERKYDLLLELGEERTYNIQLSGGEPTVRDDLPDIIRMGKEKGFEFIQINTNGRRLATEKGYARLLKEAGASVIFLQFDGTNDDIYKELRGEPLFEQKKKAVKNCREAGLPVTIVPTVVRNVNLGNVGDMIRFLLENVDVVKGIHFQPVSFFGRYPDRLPQNEADGEEIRYGDYENRVTMFDIMRELEEQTEGALHGEDFYPITSGHPLCCFQSSYQKMPDGRVKSLINYGTKRQGLSCCEAKDPLEIIKKDRNFVVNKWNIPEENSGGNCGCAEEVPASSNCDGDTSTSCGCGGQGLLDFDQFLAEMRRNMFSVSCMAFMDNSNLDAERLKRCRVQVLSPDDRLIPFCAYNSIYRI